MTATIRLHSLLLLTAISSTCIAGSFRVDEAGNPTQVIVSRRPATTVAKEITNNGPGDVYVHIVTKYGFYDVRVGNGNSYDLNEAACAEVSISIVDTTSGNDKAQGFF